ncbi:MAG: hypothetical protein HQL12_02030 [Candidatus Omnitrophica bacterium]|nr:hypothetical protein [Candidatus Omnitrophota bacterium]
MDVEQIVYKEHILAFILRNDFDHQGIHFFTPDDFSQQLAHMRRPGGYVIDPHVHNAVPRKIEWTLEVLFIKRGKVRVDFYDQKRIYLESRVLTQGDVILLAQGGHGFTMLEESEIIEVKQGPYAGDQDKTRFSGIKDNQVQFKDPS